MQMQKNSVKTTLIASLLILSMSTLVVLLPSVEAHTPPWTIISYAYVVAAPNPIGVGQPVSIVMWVDTPLPVCNRQRYTTSRLHVDNN